MATYTPNYNLSKPEATDDFDAFRASYGDNMDKIDLNMGGGGGGGHTIVDPDGTDMPQENKLQFTGNVSVSDDSANGQTVVDIEGGGNYYLNTLYSTEEKKVGYWTDGKPLYQKTVVLNNLSVTNNQWARTNESATDIETIADGFLIDNQSPSQTFQCDIGVDGGYIAVLTWFVGNSTRTMSYLTFRYTKTTDTPELNPQTGGVIYLPSIYSTEEREVGCFADGKPLYQKTVNFGSLPANNGSKTVAHGISNLETLVNAVFVVQSSAQFRTLPNVSRGNVANQTVWYMTTTDIGVLTGSNADVGSTYSGYVTIWYTKTTDTAGSGIWTPSGANAVHYSTNEQVVGTYIDGKPLYEKTFTATLNNIANDVATNVADISGLNIDEIADISGRCNYYNGANWFNVDFSTYYAIYAYTNGYLQFKQKMTNATVDRTYKLLITLRYTKTTD